MRILLFVFIFAINIMAQSYGISTSTGLGLEFDNTNTFDYSLYSSSVNMASSSGENVYVQVLFNTPEYIYQYYSDYARYAKLSKAKATLLIERNFDYARRYLWFEVTIRASHIEDLLINTNECFVLENDQGERVRPMVVGLGTLPRYNPMEVDGQIYDFLPWEKTFSMKFPLDIINEETTSIVLKSICLHKILGSWDITSQLRSQYYLKKDE